MKPIMFFRKRQPVNTDKSTAEMPATTSSSLNRVSTAETAHLIGPGCVKLVGSVPIWKPVTGATLQMHPEYLRRVLCYGNVDFSTAVLRLFWRRNIHVVFLSPHGRRLLGRLQPPSDTYDLQRLQHLAAQDPRFRIQEARRVLNWKLESLTTAARYFQQQGRGQAGEVLDHAKRSLERVAAAQSIAELNGLEGAAAACWFRYLATVLPPGWKFDRRAYHPPPDPVNALLSLGYSLAYSQCETLLAAAGLDPRVGFLHELHPGRSSLACDLVEPLRAPLVDRLVVGMLMRKSFTLDSFEQKKKVWRLTPDEFRKFLSAFEEAWRSENKAPSHYRQSELRIDQWRKNIRAFGSQE